MSGAPETAHQMTLTEKVEELKLTAYRAMRLAVFWEGTIKAQGAHKAEDFYRHLGLNHIDSVVLGKKQPAVQVAIDVRHDSGVVVRVPERKGFEWEGLTLSREPKEHEKLAVKGIHQAQQSAKESISTILLNLRQELITDGLEGISKLDPAKYHTLVLQAPPEFRKSLRDRLVSTYRQGRRLVATELGAKPATASLSDRPHRYHFNDDELISPCNCPAEKKQDEDDEFDELDDLVGVTDARVSNDVQSRITAAAARFALLGFVGSALLNSVRSEVEAGSVSYIDRASTGVANRVINIGRGDEAEDRKDEWSRVEYSALLDANVCGPCAAEDGEEAATEDELTPAPNPDCEGGDWCRCFHVFVQD